MTTKSKILSAAMFILCAGGIGGLLFLLHQLRETESVILLVSLSSLLLFLVASVAIFYRPKIGYGVGLAAGLLALVWLVRSELALAPWLNSWIALNESDRFGSFLVLPAVVKIASTALVVIAVSCSALRLLPTRWTFRGRPVRERTWPAVALTTLVLAMWFGWAVRPYRLPGMVDLGIPPTLRILHVEKRGLRFQETFIATSRDGRFWIVRDDRRLFEYQFQKNLADGVMPRAVEEDVNALVRSLQVLPMQMPKTLRSWNAEGWCAVGAQVGFRTFTSEEGTTPPADLIRVFRELDALKPDSTTRGKTRDVCLGFCYDPVAGLGFVFANQRCTDSSTGYKCR
ncbi:MAG TPA: hypothetical protein VMB02_04355 [Candidatus Aquilonibacter sp.]|nr:hypothetical protein [Candidatus Aquilonibacter sp.]